MEWIDFVLFVSFVPCFVRFVSGFFMESALSVPGSPAALES